LKISVVAMLSFSLVLSLKAKIAPYTLSLFQQIAQEYALHWKCPAVLTLISVSGTTKTEEPEDGQATTAL
jgi:hypothetical protein